MSHLKVDDGSYSLKQLSGDYIDVGGDYVNIDDWGFEERSSRKTKSRSRSCWKPWSRIPWSKLSVRLPIPADWPGWRVPILYGAILTFIVLFINAGILIGAAAAKKSSSIVTADALVLYAGSCQTSERLSIAVHLFINIFSTVIFMTSTACIQVILAPSREDVDECHMKGHWLHLGVINYRNFFRIPQKRGWLAGLLVVSSLLLHLLYNAAIFQALTTVDYSVTVVAKDFLPSGPFNTTIGQPNLLASSSVCDPNEYQFNPILVPPTPQDHMSKILQAFQAHAADLVRLENQDCLNRFQARSVTEFASVLLVSDQPSSLEAGWASWSRDVFDDASIQWPCLGFAGVTNSDLCGAILTCVQEGLNASSFTMPLPGAPSPGGPPIGSISPNFVNIHHCMALPSEATCTVNVSRTLMSLVIVAIIIKLGCFVWMLFLTIREPLVTIGDAIASFVREPDQTTQEQSYLSYKFAKKGKWGLHKMHMPPRWTDDKHFWITVFDEHQYGVTLLIMLGCLFTGCVFLYEDWSVDEGVISSTDQTSQNPIWKLNSISTNSPRTSSTKLLGALITTTLPQLPLAITNVLYNSVWSTLSLCSEYQRYSRKRRGLRVTQPRGSQRRTYRFSMPYRHLIPQTIAWAVLHFLLSTTLTTSITNVRDALGQPTDSFLYTTQWMPGTSLLAVILYGTMFLLMLGQAGRRYDGTMPLASTCSAAISAACHPLDNGKEKTCETDALMYGHNEGLTEKRAYRAAFSAGKVKRLVDGVRYQ